MQNLRQLVHRILELRRIGAKQVTLLAVCPNSDAVLEAAVKAAMLNRSPMLFAATLNQVDRDGGYTGWKPADFVARMNAYADKYHWEGPLYPCLDHGGPWLKDLHSLNKLSYQQTMEEVKLTLTACLSAGYQLLHIDPTVDRTLPVGTTVPVETVVSRTIELIGHSEKVRKQMGLPPIAYEVGSEEVHGGLVDLRSFTFFLQNLKAGLQAHDLMEAWPSFVVAQVGTDLHTTFFDSTAAERLFEIVAPYGTLCKGHYTDWVENPHEYPLRGMGGANVGPEFTSAEYRALKSLCQKEASLCSHRHGIRPSGFMQALEEAVVESNRWRKWLQPDEKGKEFAQLSPARRDWLSQTGARYVWTTPSVTGARQQLYHNLSAVMADPHGYVVDQIEKVIDAYINAFNLFDFLQMM